MATTEMVDAFVRHLLAEKHGDDLEELADGGYVVPVADGVRVWVIDGNHRSRRVLVTAPIREVGEATEHVLRVLNRLTAATPYGRYFHHEGVVVVEDTVLAEELQPGALSNAIGFVAWATDNARSILAEAFDDVDHSGQGPATDAAAGADEVHLSDRARPLGEVTTPETTPTSTGSVSAVGYL